MGFGSAKHIASKGTVGRGFDRVWLNKLDCSGEESSLEECSHPGFGVLNDYWCERHYDDVGLICNYPQDSLDCDPKVRCFFCLELHSVLRGLPASTVGIVLWSYYHGNHL